jgi:hypothetical protein
MACLITACRPVGRLGEAGFLLSSGDASKFLLAHDGRSFLLGHSKCDLVMSSLRIRPFRDSADRRQANP